MLTKVLNKYSITSSTNLGTISTRDTILLKGNSAWYSMKNNMNHTKKVMFIETTKGSTPKTFSNPIKQANNTAREWECTGTDYIIQKMKKKWIKCYSRIQDSWDKQLVFLKIFIGNASEHRWQSLALPKVVSLLQLNNCNNNQIQLE